MNKWMSPLHVGRFRLFVGLDDADPYTCVQITDSVVERREIIENIFTCTETYTINKIKISNAEEYPLKIYEVKIMGMAQNVKLCEQRFFCIFRRLHAYIHRYILNFFLLEYWFMFSIFNIN